MTTTIEHGKADLGLDEVIVVSGLSVYDVELSDLLVRRGEVVALVGPNASGKSTVSRIVVGALTAAAGSVRVLGLDPVDDRIELKLRVGFLVQDLDTMGSLNSRDVLDICAAVRGCTTSFALELAERLRLDLDRPMAQLCQGQLRRLGIVQALMHRPEAIVLDDPMTHLDEHGRRTLAVVLREVAAAGAAVLVTTPSAEEAAAYASRTATFLHPATPDASPPVVSDSDPLPVTGTTASAETGFERDSRTCRTIRTDIPEHRGSATTDVRRGTPAHRPPTRLTSRRRVHSSDVHLRLAVRQPGRCRRGWGASARHPPQPEGP